MRKTYTSTHISIAAKCAQEVEERKLMEEQRTDRAGETRAPSGEHELTSRYRSGRVLTVVILGAIGILTLSLATLLIGGGVVLLAD
jgi:hypothetical protein